MHMKNVRFEKDLDIDTTRKPNVSIVKNYKLKTATIIGGVIE